MNLSYVGKLLGPKFQVRLATLAEALGTMRHMYAEMDLVQNSGDKIETWAVLVYAEPMGSAEAARCRAFIERKRAILGLGPGQVLNVGVRDTGVFVCGVQTSTAQGALSLACNFISTALAEAGVIALTDISASVEPWPSDLEFG
jgi:hypothetical protein